MEFECPHTHLVSTVYISSIMAVQFSEFNVFVQHETLGLRKFESLLREDRYISVPEAFRLTFGVLASPTLQAATEPGAPPVVTPPTQIDPLNWLGYHSAAASYSFKPQEKHRVDQDLRTATVAILRAIYEFGPIQCNLSQVHALLACTEHDLKNNPMYAGFNDRGLCDATRESMFRKYMTVGYKGTGAETINNVCMFTDSELTALLSMEAFDEESALPEPLSKTEIYNQLRATMESKDSCDAFVKKFALFQPFFKKVKDADEKLGRRTKMWVPASGQNRINATERVASLEEGDPERFKTMERWTMHFWRYMPRTCARYISEENQGRDGEKQTILDAENIHKAADNRNSLIGWDTQHKRWARLPEDEQIRSVDDERCPDQIGCVIFWYAYMSERCPDDSHSSYQFWAVPRQWLQVALILLVLVLTNCRRRNVLLRFWNYPNVEDFSRNDPLFKNKFAFTIPLLATLTSPLANKMIDLCEADLAGELPFQVWWHKRFT